MSELARRAGWPLHHPMVPPERAVTVTIEDETKGVWLVEPKADDSAKPVDNMGLPKADGEINLLAPGPLSIPVAQMRSSADADPAAPGVPEIKSDVTQAAPTASDARPGGPEAVPAASGTKLADMPAATPDSAVPAAAQPAITRTDDSQAPAPHPPGRTAPDVGSGAALT